MFLPKFLGGGQGFQEKLPGGYTYFAFYCIFINKFFENLPGGVLFHTPPSPPLTPPVCIYVHSSQPKKEEKNLKLPTKQVSKYLGYH